LGFAQVLRPGESQHRAVPPFCSVLAWYVICSLLGCWRTRDLGSADQQESVMHREEWEEEQPCADCGTTVFRSSDLNYPFDDQILCWQCAVRRGGKYDAIYERWTLCPELSELMEPRRMHH
jgi:hypothetical protein